MIPWDPTNSYAIRMTKLAYEMAKDGYDPTPNLIIKWENYYQDLLRPWQAQVNKARRDISEARDYLSVKGSWGATKEWAEGVIANAEPIRANAKAMISVIELERAHWRQILRCTDKERSIIWKEYY